MKLKRKLFFKIHGWIGIKLSILFFIVCFSGTLATLSYEMDWLFLPESRAGFQPQLASKNLIVNNIEEQYPGGKIEFWSALDEPYLCNIVYVKNEGKRWYVFVNQYTGEVQGAVTLTFQRFFRDLHYYLFIPFQIGHFMVLVFAFLLFISIATGLLFYKKWYRKLFVLTTNKGYKVFFRSLHRLVGVWSIPFTILFSITGIWYFIERANIGGVSREVNYAIPSYNLSQEEKREHDENYTYQINYDKAVQVAKSEIPGLFVKDIVPPGKPGQALYINGLTEVPLVRNRANRVYLHPFTFEVLKVQKARQVNTVTWINDIADPLHFGYWGGLTTKIIYFLAGLAISGLIVTGIWISLKRKVKNVRQLKVQKMGGWKYINYLVVILALILMYATLINRYHASVTALVVVTVGWLLIALAGWYIFSIKIKDK